MSYNTEVVLLTGEDEDVGIVERLNEWLLERCRASFKKVSKYSGGRSKPRTAVWMTVANYLPRDDFAALVRSAAWSEPLRVQLYYRSESEMTFTDMTRRT